MVRSDVEERPFEHGKLYKAITAFFTQGFDFTALWWVDVKKRALLLLPG